MFLRAWFLSWPGHDIMWPVKEALKVAQQVSGYETLKKHQQQAIEAYLCGKDVFLSTPMGEGKSLTFELAPFALDYMLFPLYPWRKVYSMHWHCRLVCRRWLQRRITLGHTSFEVQVCLWKSRSATQQLLKHLSPIKIRTESYNRRRKSLHSEVASVYNLLFRNRFVYSTNGLHCFRGYFLALIPAFTCTRNITLGLIYVFLLTPIEPSLTLIWNDHSF